MLRKESAVGAALTSVKTPLVEFERRALEALRSAGLRLTAPRRAVVSLLARSVTACSPAEIFERLDGEAHHVDRATVYRVLETLRACGLVHDVHAAGGYRACEPGHDPSTCHHHVVCRCCGAIEEVDCGGLDPLIEALARSTRFHIDEHRLEFIGTCDACARGSAR